MFKFDEMAALVKGVDDEFAAAGTNNPQFAGKKVLLLEGSIVDDTVHVLTPAWRSDFLTQMGLSIPDIRRQHDHARQHGFGARRGRCPDLDRGK